MKRYPWLLTLDLSHMKRHPSFLTPDPPYLTLHLPQLTPALSRFKRRRKRWQPNKERFPPPAGTTRLALAHKLWWIFAV